MTMWTTDFSREGNFLSPVLEEVEGVDGARDNHLSPCTCAGEGSCVVGADS